jgi:hypothetical protein
VAKNHWYHQNDIIWISGPTHLEINCGPGWSYCKLYVALIKHAVQSSLVNNVLSGIYHPLSTIVGKYVKLAIVCAIKLCGKLKHVSDGCRCNINANISARISIFFYITEIKTLIDIEFRERRNVLHSWVSWVDRAAKLMFLQLQIWSWYWYLKRDCVLNIFCLQLWATNALENLRVRSKRTKKSCCATMFTSTNPKNYVEFCLPHFEFQTWCEQNSYKFICLRRHKLQKLDVLWQNEGNVENHSQWRSFRT